MRWDRGAPLAVANSLKPPPAWFLLPLPRPLGVAPEAVPFAGVLASAAAGGAAAGGSFARPRGMYCTSSAPLMIR